MYMTKRKVSTLCQNAFNEKGIDFDDFIEELEDARNLFVGVPVIRFEINYDNSYPRVDIYMEGMSI